MAKSQKSQKSSQSFWTNFVLIFICAMWMIPILGILITSFRPSEEIFRNGWWNVFPHKEDLEIDRYTFPEGVNLDGPITYGGRTATFQEWQRGVQLEDGAKGTWYGNKRTRTIIITGNE